MLHALLHRKLVETLPEPQRQEDALTSTVLGPLIWLKAGPTIADWLQISPEVSGYPTHSSVLDAWFWPGLAYAEPDAVLRLGRALVLVEAKYQSDRHDLSASPETGDNLCDQILRQYRSITTPVEKRVRYAEAIERAILECNLIQVFLVDARRLRRARREYMESKSLLPTGATLQLATWQELFLLLGSPQVASARWAADLRAYLTLAGLDTFRGFRYKALGGEGTRRLACWGPRRERASRLKEAFRAEHIPSFRLLREWKVPGHNF